MKTLADFKREAIVGSKWETIIKFDDGDKISRKIRTIGKRTNKEIGFFNESGLLSWLSFPKALAIHFPSPTTAKIFFNGGIILLTKIEE